MSNLEDYGLSPEEIASFEEEQKKQERLYNEYKQSGGWQKNRKLGELNPTIFSEELISSIPEDEYQELCAAYKKKDLELEELETLGGSRNNGIKSYSLYSLFDIFILYLNLG